jgi:two-component system, chemotaxis family, protein-glutamate methylesterase/glutaminase
LIAPGGNHMQLVRDGAGAVVKLNTDPLVNHHRPSVDVLFDSASTVLGPRAIGVIMTGMGDDGAAGLLRMRLAGARTLAQDEATCVVFGMPKVAIERGGVERVVPLQDLASAALHLAAEPLATKTH